MADDFWAQGDYHDVIGRHLAPVAATVVRDALGAPPGSLLDVGCGTGNAAIEAARRGATTTGLDLSPGMLRAAQRRAAGVTVRFVHGDAQHLPFADRTFDAVVSIFAHVFAPDPERATREMLRVASPDGRIAYTAWRPDGASGAMNDAIHHARPDIPLEALRAGTKWAEPGHVRERLGRAVRVRTTDGEVAFPAHDAADFIDAHARASPGMIGVLRPFGGQELVQVKKRLAAALSPHHRNGAVRFAYRCVQVEPVPR